MQRDEGAACRAMGHQQIVRGTKVQPAVQRDEGPDCRAMGHQQIVRGTMVQPAVQRDEGLIWIECFHVHSTDVACPRSRGSLGDVNLNQAVALCSTMREFFEKFRWGVSGWGGYMFEPRRISLAQWRRASDLASLSQARTPPRPNQIPAGI